MRDRERIVPLLAKVAEAWQKDPDQRFGQFLVNFFGECGQDVWHTEDDEWMVGLQAFINGKDPKAAMDAYFDQKWPQ